MYNDHKAREEHVEVGHEYAEYLYINSIRLSVDFIATVNIYISVKCPFIQHKAKGKVFYGQEPPRENLLPQNVGSIINYLQ